jgi:uncharacterized protein (TIGR02145 family)
MKNLLLNSGVILFFLVTISIHSCKKQEVPILTTSEIINITATSATCGGTITDEGSGTITARGVCWSTEGEPTIADNTTINGSGIGSFISTILSLDDGVTYYVRAYATNEAGTGYGLTLSFTTMLVDIDGNAYNIISIGNQYWMKENLKTTKYRNGDLIGTTSPATLNIGSESSPKYQWTYEGVESNVNTYGRLYTWYAVTDVRNVCPSGWHVPSDDEWMTLMDNIGGASINGGKLKETGMVHWASPNTGATNETGFTALPGGGRNEDSFLNIGNSGFWWSATESGSDVAWSWSLSNNISEISRLDLLKLAGFSVRCIKN